MSLVESLEEEMFSQSCRTCEWYGKLTTEDKDAFDEWVAGGGSKRGLHRACAKNGLTSGMTQFREHLEKHHLDLNLDTSQFDVTFS